MNAKPKLLIFTDWFAPAFKAGGPITSLKHFEQHFHNCYEISIYTSASDINLKTPIVKPALINQWTSFKNRTKIYYADSSKTKLSSVKKVIQDINPNHIYLNSLFSKAFTFYPLLYKNKSQINYVLAPRGMLGKNSLKIKSFKKMSFLKIAKAFNLYESVTWQSTSKQEQIDILKHFPRAVVKYAPNLGIKIQDSNGIEKRKTFSGRGINLLYVGRISPIKNLKRLLELLFSVPIPLQEKFKLSIVGPIEDYNYYKQCLQISNQLQLDSIQFHGAISPPELEQYYLNAHFYISTSLHENYGHTIAEALSYATPIIVSHYTPWNTLEKRGVGWNIELKKTKEFNELIKKITQLTSEEYQKYSNKCIDYYKSIDQQTDKYKLLFTSR